MRPFEPLVAYHRMKNYPNKFQNINLSESWKWKVHLFGAEIFIQSRNLVNLIWYGSYRSQHIPLTIRYIMKKRNIQYRRKYQLNIFSRSWKFEINLFDAVVSQTLFQRGFIKGSMFLHMSSMSESKTETKIRQ